MRNNKFVFAVLAPVFLLIATFQIIPIFLGLGISFFKYSPLNTTNDFIGVANFTKLFGDPVFYKAFGNTLYFVVVCTVINLVVTLVIAQIISVFRKNGIRSLFRVIFFLPCVASLAATGWVWSRLYDQRYGFINVILNKLFDMPYRPWLGEPATVLPAIVVFSLWADIGYNIVLFCAGIDGIPADFYEAAIIDGAGPVARFFKITLPLLARTTCFVMAMTLIFYFQSFAQFVVMTRDYGGQNDIGLVLSLFVYRTAFRVKDMGYASTISLGLFLVIMVFTVISQKINKVDWGY
ncbi:sugar ABC transporter permease [Spirochaetia bacterium]|nr:sugar ABC transporter permease [Spirochaetia bacterium]